MRGLLRIDVYVVSDEGDVEVLIGDMPAREVKAATPKAKKPQKTPGWKTDAEYLLARETIPDRKWTNEPRLKGEKRDAFIRRVLGQHWARG